MREKRYFQKCTVIVALSIVTCLFLGMGFASAQLPKRGTLNVCVFSGSYGESYRKAFIEPAEKALNIKIKADHDWTYWVPKVMMNPDDPPFDLLIGLPFEIVKWKKLGLLAEFDMSKMTNFKDLWSVFQWGAPYGIAFASNCEGLVYNTERVKQAPKSIKDYWKSPWLGKRIGFPGLPNHLGVLWFHMINKVFGGDYENLDPGFEALKKLNLQYVAPDFTTAYQDLSAGRLDMLFWIDDIAYQFQDKGAPIEFVYPEEGGIRIISLHAITKGSKNKELAMEYVNWIISQAPQTHWSIHQNMGTTNSKVVLPPYAADRSFYGEERVLKANSFDPDEMMKTHDELMERWKLEIGTL